MFVSITLFHFFNYYFNLKNQCYVRRWTRECSLKFLEMGHKVSRSALWTPGSRVQELYSEARKTREPDPKTFTVLSPDSPAWSCSFAKPLISFGFFYIPGCIHVWRHEETVGVRFKTTQGFFSLTSLDLSLVKCTQGGFCKLAKKNKQTLDNLARTHTHPHVRVS